MRVSQMLGVVTRAFMLFPRGVAPPRTLERGVAPHGLVIYSVLITLNIRYTTYLSSTSALLPEIPFHSNSPSLASHRSLARHTPSL